MKNINNNSPNPILNNTHTFIFSGYLENIHILHIDLSQLHKHAYVDIAPMDRGNEYRFVHDYISEEHRNLMLQAENYDHTICFDSKNNVINITDESSRVDECIRNEVMHDSNGNIYILNYPLDAYNTAGIFESLDESNTAYIVEYANNIFNHSDIYQTNDVIFDSGHVVFNAQHIPTTLV